MELSGARPGLLRSLVVGAALLGLQGPAFAQISTFAPTPTRFEISAGDLKGALTQFARQSNQQLLYSGNLVAGLRTRGFRGPGVPTDVLSRLLEGTHLSYQVSRSGTLLVVPRPPVTAAAGPLSPSPRSQPRVMLEEVLVTATRQVSTVNKAPLSLTAITAGAMDRTGVKTAQDLARTVPSVIFRRIGNEGNPTVAIRGVASSLGSPTTAVYLDDTALQKRDMVGVSSGNGTPFPQMFDLERVEVLRGPQGTLYGASAEGGAIRFITPAPSLTIASGLARAEASLTRGGGSSREMGVAVGGPIVRDRLGFRISLWNRHTGGYIDHTSIYDGAVIAKNTNRGDSKALRLAIAWAPAPSWKITPAVYVSKEHVSDGDLYWEDVPQFSSNPGTFTNRGSVNGVAFDFPDKAYVGGSYGPYAFGPGKNGSAVYDDEGHDAQAALAPRTTRLLVPSLTIDYAGDRVVLKAISSYVSDQQKGSNPTGPSVRSSAVLPTTTSAGFVDAAGQPVPGGVGYVPIIVPGFPGQYNFLYYRNARTAFSQEVRLSSPPGDGRLSWVAGLFFSTARSKVYTWGRSNTDALSILLRGVPEQWLIGNANFPGGVFTIRDIDVRERELAAFGEANYALTPRLTATAGVRVSRINVRLRQFAGGPSAGTPADFVGAPAPPAVITDVNQPNHAFTDMPGDDPFVRFSGEQNERPVNPKLGLSYRLGTSDLLYVTVARGYRSGGINQPASPVNCAADLAALNLSGVGTPLTYDSDSVWSYEAGAKLRLLHQRVQLNSSLFYIDWKDPQLSLRLRCSQAYVTNVGAATSQGFDVQAEARLPGGVTLNGAVTFTQASYANDVVIAGPGGARSTVVAKGDSLGAPKWQFIMGAQYDFGLAGRPAYLRADYQYSGPYKRGPGPGRVGYDPLTYQGDATHHLSARAGVTLGAWEWAVFGDNLTQSGDRLYEAHTPGFALVTATGFRPLEAGLQATYRY